MTLLSERLEQESEQTRLRLVDAPFKRTNRRGNRLFPLFVKCWVASRIAGRREGKFTSTGAQSGRAATPVPATLLCRSGARGNAVFRRFGYSVVADSSPVGMAWPIFKRQIMIIDLRSQRERLLWRSLHFCRCSSPAASAKARHNLFSRFGEGAQPRGDQRPRRRLAMMLLW